MDLIHNTGLQKAIKVALAFIPWLASMFLLYWLEYGQIWNTETPHRGKTSVAILVTGMLLSFFMYSRPGGFSKKSGGAHPDQNQHNVQDEN